LASSCARNPAQHQASLVPQNQESEMALMSNTARFVRGIF
jgi:hypothetical protein